MLWLLCGPSRAMESQALVIRIKIPDGGAVDWTVHSAPQLLFRDVLVSPSAGGSPGTPPTLPLPGEGGGGLRPGGDAGVSGSVSAERSPGAGGERGNKNPPWKAKGVRLLAFGFCF